MFRFFMPGKVNIILPLQSKIIDTVPTTPKSIDGYNYLKEKDII
jgi:hypothetical protein